MRFILLLIIATLTVQCMKPRKTAEYKSSNIVAHPTFTVSGGSVFCDIYFSLKDDPSGVAVALESDAVVTCNLSPIQPVGTVYTISLTYVPGTVYTLTVVRPVDGSSIVESQIVP